MIHGIKWMVDGRVFPDCACGNDWAWGIFCHSQFVNSSRGKKIGNLNIPKQNFWIYMNDQQRKVLNMERQKVCWYCCYCNDPTCHNRPEWTGSSNLSLMQL